jgi:hypothetical protein
VHAAKKRVRSTVQTQSTRTPVGYSKVKLNRTTHSIICSFTNIQQVKEIRYTLAYSSNGIAQGVMGTIVPAGQTEDSRDLYFGTCSKGVCTAHYNITNASLLVETTLQSGSVHKKRYLIRY